MIPHMSVIPLYVGNDVVDRRFAGFFARPLRHDAEKWLGASRPDEDASPPGETLLHLLREDRKLRIAAGFFKFGLVSGTDVAEHLGVAYAGPEALAGPWFVDEDAAQLEGTEQPVSRIEV